MNTKLPIHTLCDSFYEALALGPVVITSPTGSGKSTQIPRWCRQQDERVLVIEPRRVACRSLAQRVAELEGTSLGQEVGYRVRDENRARDSTKIVFATTGVVLRLLASLEELPFDTIILDEFHERSLDMDLLFALFARSAKLRASGMSGKKLVVMSATLDGERVAEHLDGTHLRAEGRLYPVQHHYLAGDETLLPDTQGLESRILRAMETAKDAPGHILVFLPGKAEIASATQALQIYSPEFEILPLHGGLTLEEQSRVFHTSRRRKVVLATNVAETSVTIPGISVVIDSGFVRRTRYHRGRGYLTLSPIALDSADQRAGRAGRTSAGLCVRLWSKAALLEKRTPPEIYRESLAPLVLAAATCRARPEDLPFLDLPKEYALESAREELRALGAFDEKDNLTERGRRLFGLPVDPALGRLLVEAESQGCLEDAVDLVAALSVSRPLFRGARDPQDEREDDPRAEGCDATALIAVIRMQSRRWKSKVNPYVLSEARGIASRLRRAFGLTRISRDSFGTIDRERLAKTAIAADPRCVHVARSRRGRTTWSNGGTEIELARESALSPTECQAAAVLENRALGTGKRKTKIIATCAIPLELRWLHQAGLGHDRLRDVALEDRRVVATIDRVYARRVIGTKSEVPRGSLARNAIRELFIKGAIFPEALDTARTRLEAHNLLARLFDAGHAQELATIHLGELELIERRGRTAVDLSDWIEWKLEELGLDSGDDLELLAAQDLLPPVLPARVLEWLDRAFPRLLSFGDVRYRIEYDLENNEVVLLKVSGRRQEPPPLSYLPAFQGFRVILRDRSRVFVLRD